MFQRKHIEKLNDFFLDMDKRPEKGFYFYRINGYNTEIGDFIQYYYERARKCGVIIEGRIPNPDEKNLEYYTEIMGMDFQMNKPFIENSLRKWLPRMNDYQRRSVADSIYNTLENLKKAGKNDNMLKNAYIKFMCWLYYKFERIVNQLGENSVPKILYEGEISSYELMLISILSGAGCDVVILQYNGDGNYLKLDAQSMLSDKLELTGMGAFPSSYCLKMVLTDIQDKINNEKIYGIKPKLMNCTNAWIKGKGLEDILTSTLTRGRDEKFFYNCYIRINGVKDKITYQNELFQFQQELKNNKRKVVIIDSCIPQPSMDEIAKINRKNYTKNDQMIMDLSANIQYSANLELQRIMVKSFVDIMLTEAKQPGMNLNKLTNKAVYILCWLKRYQHELFNSWKQPDIGCFIYMGGCKNENEGLFMSFLGRIPVDVLILNPNLNVKCCLKDNILYEMNYTTSLAIDKFPQQNTGLHIGTAAYHAERELDTIMYQDSGIYRNQQYIKGNVVNLETMYEEIALMWDEELKYRPHFSTVDDVVNMPVIFAKISGVKDGQEQMYWSSIKQLMTPDTIVVKNPPFIQMTKPNQVKQHATEFFKNGRLLKDKIKQHSTYQYEFLREEIQNHMLDKLQMMIEQRIIRGTFENGTEYTVISTVLNIPMEILRIIQKFDFTKKNPKILYINTGESFISLEDSIIIAFLNLVGFDIVFFVPTGYQNVEKYYNKPLMEEHQIGEYMYDLQIPNFEAISLNTRQKWRDKIFKRGT